MKSKSRIPAPSPRPKSRGLLASASGMDSRIARLDPGSTLSAVRDDSFAVGETSAPRERLEAPTSEGVR
jgi:hypothetical protein